MLLASTSLSDSNSGKLSRLRYCQLILTLDLSKNALSDSSCRVIATALKAGGAKVKRINLSSNNITDVGAGEIAELLTSDTVRLIFSQLRNRRV